MGASDSLAAAAAEEEEGAHEEQDGDGLTHDAEAHEALAGIGRAALRHVPEAHAKDDDDKEKGQRDADIEKSVHEDLTCGVQP